MNIGPHLAITDLIAERPRTSSRSKCRGILKSISAPPRAIHIQNPWAVGPKCFSLASPDDFPNAPHPPFLSPLDIGVKKGSSAYITRRHVAGCLRSSALPPDGHGQRLLAHVLAGGRHNHRHLRMQAISSGIVTISMSLSFSISR